MVDFRQLGYGDLLRKIVMDILADLFDAVVVGGRDGIPDNQYQQCFYIIGKEAGA